MLVNSIKKLVIISTVLGTAEDSSETSQTSKMECLWLLTVNYFCKGLRLRYVTGF